MQLSEHGARRVRRGARAFVAPDAVLVPLLLLIFGYAIFFAQLRSLGVLPLAVTAAAGVGIYVLAGVRLTNFHLLIFGIVGAAYVFLSLAFNMGEDITLLYIPDAIPQQAAYVLLLFFFIPAMQFFCEQIRAGNRTYINLERVIFAGCILSIVSYHLLNPRLTGLLPTVMTLTNVNMIFLFILFRNIAERFSQLGWVSKAGLFIIPLLTSSIQSLISSTAFLVFALVRRVRVPASIIIILVFFVSPIVLTPYGDYIYNEVDANSGVRIWIWGEVFTRVTQSGFIGVGFGSETIPPYFLHEGGQFILRAQESDSFVHIGSHNAFLDAYYRMGILGVGVLLSYIALLVMPFFRRKEGRTAYDNWVIATLILTMSVNVALASFNFFFGTCLLIGWLEARRRELAQLQ